MKLFVLFTLSRYKYERKKCVKRTTNFNDVHQIVFKREKPGDECNELLWRTQCLPLLDNNFTLM